jgi:hypothetical protein
MLCSIAIEVSANLFAVRSTTSTVSTPTSPATVSRSVAQDAAGTRSRTAGGLRHVDCWLILPGYIAWATPSFPVRRFEFCLRGFNLRGEVGQHCGVLALHAVSEIRAPPRRPSSRPAVAARHRALAVLARRAQRDRPSTCPLRSSSVQVFSASCLIVLPEIPTDSEKIWTLAGDASSAPTKDLLEYSRFAHEGHRCEGRLR